MPVDRRSFFLTAPAVLPAAGSAAIGSEVGVSVKMPPWRAKGNEQSDDSGAVKAAIAAVAAAGGGVVYVPPGVYSMDSPLGALPANVTLAGEGKKVSVLSRRFATGPLITQMGPHSALHHLAIDGGGFDQDILTVTGGISQNFQTMLLVRLFNTRRHAVSFARDSGTEFRAFGCEFMTAGKLGEVAAVATLGTDSQAVPRHFIDCAGEGSTLYDFTGANDTFVHGGYTNGIITGDATSKLTIVNLRVGAAAGPPTIKGENLSLQNVVFANPVTLTCRDSIFNCIVPDWDVTDKGRGNSVFQRLRRYTPAWTGSISDPGVGNGLVQGYYSRQGAQVTVQINLDIGSATSFGRGSWRFSLPQPGADPYSLAQVVGSGFTQQAGPRDFMVTPRTVAGENFVELFYVDASGVLRELGSDTQAWAVDGKLRFSFTYLTK